jgi:hypothetical protein
LSKQPEVEGSNTVIRRRRTRRHRRNRHIRIFLVAFCALLSLGFAAVALHHLAPSLFRASRAEPNRQSAEASRARLVATQQEVLRDMQSRPVYPYSVIPGGVRDGRELKWVAQHDPVVARHYAGFDYDHARVVRLVLARTAYLSYRIGNKVYWTRHRISLKKGETILTDGKISARARCGNRVETLPQQAMAESEPPYVAFEQPLLPATAISNPPLPYQSSLLTPPGIEGPAPPLSLYDPLWGGNFIPLLPPALPGVCGIGKNKNGSGGTSGTGKKKGNPCAQGGGGGEEVPEPATWVLVLSAVCAMLWLSRHRLVRN